MEFGATGVREKLRGSAPPEKGFVSLGRLDMATHTRTMLISPKSYGYGPGAMLSLTTSCPKCRHVFPLEQGGACPSPCPPPSRARLALSGGRLLPPPAPKAAAAALSSPPCPAPSPSPSPSPSPYLDLERLERAVRALRLCGWYYEDLTQQASQAALQRRRPGTFLLRDSGDSNFLYSLSVQTARGPTSVRLHYADGLFRLDAEPGVEMPRFDCAVRLVQHYAEATRGREGREGPGQIWVDAAGSQFSSVEVRRPLLRAPPSLAHSARLAVNRALRAAASPALPLLPPQRRLGLPPRLQDFLADYPYTC